MSAHHCPHCDRLCTCSRYAHIDNCEHDCSRLDVVRNQLALELRADVLNGRGKMPRDASGRVVQSFLAHERPQERDVPRRPGLESLTALFAGIEIPIAPDVEILTTRVARLETLERQLEQLLSTNAPHLWRQIRAPLRRLLNRARRELRAADRADFTAT
jgi:hypothetical protein